MRQHRPGTATVTTSSSTSIVSLDHSFLQHTADSPPTYVTVPVDPPLDRVTVARALATASSSLTDALSQVSAAHQEIERLSRFLASLPPISASPSRRVPSSTRHPLLPGGSFCLGDRVRILNPRPHQQNSGVIESARNDYVYVRTPNGSLVHRFETNLRLL